MTIQIGQLRDRVTFSTPSVATDTTGQQIESFGSPFTVWAMIEFLPAGEINAYDGTEAKKRVKIITRFGATELTERMKVALIGSKWKNATYNVLSVRFTDSYCTHYEVIAELLQ